MNAWNKEAGFSLTELIVALALSVMLVFVLIQQLLLVSREAVHVHQALDENTELQWVVDWMRMRIHHAGFTPCYRLDKLKTRDTRAVPEPMVSVAVSTDKEPTLSIKKLNEQATLNAEIKYPNELWVKAYPMDVTRPILVSDCMHAEVHDVDYVIKNQEGYALHLKKPLAFHYPGNTYIGEFVSEAFFFRNNKLYYQHHRVNEVTSRMQNVTFKLEQKGPYTWVVMHFSTSKSAHYKLHSRLRML